VFHRRIQREINDELHLHVQMRTEEYERTGLSIRAARHKALRRFGDLREVTAACHAVYRLPHPSTGRGTFMESVWQDLRYAVRSLSRQPAFTVIALLTLAVGIGANTVIFSAVNSTMLRPIPFEGGDRWVTIWNTSPEGSMMWAPSPAAVHAWRERASSLESIATYGSTGFVMDSDGEPEAIVAAAVSVQLLPFLGIQPILGRGLVAEDTIPGNDHVVLLTEWAWRHWFNGADDVVGATMTLNREPYTVIGVLPGRADALFGPGNVNQRGDRYRAIWVPAAGTRGNIARLKPGVGIAAAQEEISAIQPQLGLNPNEPEGWGPRLHRPMEFEVTGDLQVGLWVLLGAVGFVLLVACVNVANMLLARGVTRGHEMAVRTAIGAGRGRVLRQLVVESLTLTVGAAALALAVAQITLAIVRTRLPETLSALYEVQIDTTVLAVTVGIAVLTGVAFGLVPAMQLRRLSLTPLLGTGRHGGQTMRSWASLRSMLVAAQVALATTLLVGAGLMVRSLLHLNRHDPGFNPTNLVSFRVDLHRQDYESFALQVSFLRALEARVRQLPMVESAAIGTIGVRGVSEEAIQVEGSAEPSSGRPVMMSVVSPGYFATVGMPLREGREFVDAEMTEDALEVIVNENFARTYWPGESATGKRFRFADGNPWHTVVGVAPNVAFSGLQARPDAITVYRPYPVRDLRSHIMVVRASGDPRYLIPALRGQVRSLDGNLPMRDITFATQELSDALARPRFNGILLAAFAVLAVSLAAVGVYGVVSLSMQQRTHELGVRLALGADDGQLVSLMVRQGMRPVAVGAALGLALAVGLTRFLRSLLFEVQPTDPTIFLVVAAVLAVAGFAACYWPARAAARLNPVEVLRAE
jgi:predicted permease